MHMKLSIVIPCFNEEDNIEKLGTEFFPVVESLIGSTLPDGGAVTSVEVVFVDDGSKDATYHALKTAFASRSSQKLPIKFEKHEVNRGLGAAIRTGLQASTGEIILTTDSDGTYKFGTIPALLACLQKNVDVVTASPYHPEGEVVGVPGYRIFLSKGSSLLYRILLNWNIYTYTALFRGYRRRVVEQVQFEADDYLAGTEFMVKAMLKGFNVVEFPAALHSRMFGVSKAKLWRTIKSHLRFQYRLLLHRLRLRSMFSSPA